MSNGLLEINTSPVLRASEFAQISRLAYDHFGVDLRVGKQQLLEARLGKQLRELGMVSFQDYFDYVTADTSGEALTKLVDALTTNHTSFFREARHFDFLAKTILPALRKGEQIHIWSAACSSGEEPFSIAMTLLEAAHAQTVSSIRIRATDISTRVLKKAVLGVYSADRCDAIPQPLKQRYMLKGANSSANQFRFKPQVRELVEFLHLNLMDPLPPDYRCSVLFCRNIMIYFDRPTQQSLVERLSDRLLEGGYLFIGHSESLTSLSHSLEYVAPATYRKVSGSRGRSTGRSS